MRHGSGITPAHGIALQYIAVVRDKHQKRLVRDAWQMLAGGAPTYDEQSNGWRDERHLEGDEEEEEIEASDSSFNHLRMTERPQPLHGPPSSNHSFNDSSFNNLRMTERPQSLHDPPSSDHSFSNSRLMQQPASLHSASFSYGARGAGNGVPPRAAERAVSHEGALAQFQMGFETLSDLTASRLKWGLRSWEQFTRRHRLEALNSVMQSLMHAPFPASTPAVGSRRASSNAVSPAEGGLFTPIISPKSSSSSASKSATAAALTSWVSDSVATAAFPLAEEPHTVTNDPSVSSKVKPEAAAPFASAPGAAAPAPVTVQPGEELIGEKYDSRAFRQRSREREVRAIEEAHGGNSMEVLPALFNLADQYLSSGSVQEHKSTLERALHIQELHHGPDHHGLLPTLESLAASHRALGNSAEEQQFRARCSALKAKHTGTSEIVFQPDHVASEPPWTSHVAAQSSSAPPWPAPACRDADKAAVREVLAAAATSIRSGVATGLGSDHDLLRQLCTDQARVDGVIQLATVLWSSGVLAAKSQRPPLVKCSLLIRLTERCYHATLRDGVQRWWRRAALSRSLADLGAAKNAEARAIATPALTESRAIEISSIDKVDREHFQQYAKTMSDNVSKGDESVRLEVFNFLHAQESQLENLCTTRSNFPPFELDPALAAAGRTERLVVNLVVHRIEDVFEVSCRTQMGHHVADLHQKFSGGMGGSSEVVCQDVHGAGASEHAQRQEAEQAALVQENAALRSELAEMAAEPRPSLAEHMAFESRLREESALQVAEAAECRRLRSELHLAEAAAHAETRAANETKEAATERESQLREELKASAAPRAQVVEQPSLAAIVDKQVLHSSPAVQKPIVEAAPQSRSIDSPQIPADVNEEEDEEEEESSYLQTAMARGAGGKSSPTRATGGSGLGSFSMGSSGLGSGVDDLAELLMGHKGHEHSADGLPSLNGLEHMDKESVAKSSVEDNDGDGDSDAGSLPSLGN